MATVQALPSTWMLAPDQRLASLNPTLPPVTVLVCTRNRTASLTNTIRSIAACTYPNVTLIIVDQSEDQRISTALATLQQRPALHYVSTPTRGLSQALNLGLALVNTELVMITDDDCEVPPNWIAEMMAPFLRYPRVGLVFCDVEAEPHDPTLGSVPVNVAARSMLIENLAHWQSTDGVNLGIGAGMALRLAAVRQLKGFDPCLGSGAHFRSGNDLDLALRMLIGGYQVYRTNRVSVLHHGFRTHCERRRLIRNNMFGIGAVCGKLIKCGNWRIVGYYLAIVRALVVVPTFTNLLACRKPPVLGRIVSLAEGLGAGLVAPVDRQRAMFRHPTLG
ncbi:MAG: glycosyltransferase family A protein [Chloroflexales bacterium]